MPKLVTYKGKWYIWYKTNDAGYAQLIDTDGKKFSGTPSPEKLEIITEWQSKQFNNNNYFMTQFGCFSESTGNKIVQPEILKLFDLGKW
jgi:hypothetical protein